MRGSKLKSTVKALDRKLLNQSLARAFRLWRGSMLHMSLDITSACNIECTMCSLKDWYPHAAKTITPETLDRLDWAFKRLHSVSLQCNCEPLLNKNIVSIIERIKSVNRKIEVTFVTNGMLLTKAKAKALVESGVDRVGISVDGSCKETFEKIRVGARFEQVLENIRGLVEARAEAASKTPFVEILAVSSTENIDELVSIVELTGELGADGFGMNGIEPYTEDKVSQVLYTEGTPNPAYKRVFHKMRETADRLNLTIQLPRLKSEPYTTCDMQIVVDALGDVSPCPTLSYERPYFYFGKQARHPRVVFGNVGEKSLEEIWQSKAYRKFRESGRNGKLPGCCQGCLYRNGVLCPH